MFYHNTRYVFKLADQSPDNIAGGILSACGMSRPQLARRSLRKFPYLQHRLFDPQLYLSRLDARVCGEKVVNLGSYPWFRTEHDEFESSKQEGGLTQWKKDQESVMLAGWPAAAATNDEDILPCAMSAVHFQLELGCQAIILPSPLTEVANTYEIEARWLDAGLAACESMDVSLPIYATIAVTDSVLRQGRPTDNAFLQAVTAQIASRPALRGAYIVIAQESEDSYVCKHPDTLLSLLLLVDDLARGAHRDVIVNYMGTFGAITTAVGTAIWSSGYNRSLRRLRLADMQDSDGRQYPRYFSPLLFGDIGVEEEVALVAQDARTRRALFDTPTSARLNEVMRRGGSLSEVPEWAYSPTIVAAASAHYNASMNVLGVHLESLTLDRRVDSVSKLLERAETMARKVADVITTDRRTRGHTDVSHQTIWRQVFEEWRGISGV